MATLEKLDRRMIVTVEESKYAHFVFQFSIILSWKKKKVVLSGMRLQSYDMINFTPSYHYHL